MNEKFVSNTQLAERLAERPAEYLSELERCITRRESGGFWVDVESPAYHAMFSKYHFGVIRAINIPAVGRPCADCAAVKMDVEEKL